MRACARVALVLMAVSASFGLAGCGSIDELKETISRWLDTGKLPGGREGVFPADLPDKSAAIPPEKPPKAGASKAAKKDKPARKPQRPQSVELPKKPPISDSTDAIKPQATEAPSAPPEPAPSRLRTLWPEAPAPGTFSR